MQEDEEIIEQILQGNKEIYAQIIHKYKGKVASILTKMLGHSSNMQDIVQEIFIKAYYHLPEYQSQQKFSAWLYRISINRGLDEVRKRKRTPSVIDLTFEIMDSYTPEKAYLDKEQKEFLQHLLLRVDDEYRIIIEMHYIQDLSYKEISEKLCVSMSTVRMRLSYARKKVKDEFIRMNKRGEFIYEVPEPTTADSIHAR
ncbi:RNA polymerase sigma factor [Brevibacillus laterosporus]|uniref:RNA polymerase sigma factor n=1 Tax=Brevibacillus laterosporus TaxID=1465 RepID=UPI000B9C556A|nr:RNA polymerase sigma factor [Brevibacillus laterosporus]MCG7317055.1 RNA polymerase sigma factor [Brevibacillus laterosporus]